jgi:hypothetical protein
MTASFQAIRPVAVLQRQPVEVQENLEGIQARQILHHLALTPVGEGADHLSGMPLQYRS